MKTLKLFNSVIKKESGQMTISEDGIIIEEGAVWAKDKITDYYRKNKLTPSDLNKTFHKSWIKIKNSSRFELYVEQILHYMSTYGTDFDGEAYIPNELLDLSGAGKIKMPIIKAYTKKELKDKCLNLLKSGIALEEETINDILSVLVDELGFIFTGEEHIKNKEAIIKIADLYGVIPKDTMEFFRYIIYRSTGESLLIKSPEVIEAIQQSNYNPMAQFKKHGLNKLAEIFNRFKPLFLAFKRKCPGTINKISKLSKKHHKPLIENPLNKATSEYMEDLSWLDNATPFALFRALSACYSRINSQTDFIYSIRNGKSWVKEQIVSTEYAKKNYNIILDYMKSKSALTGKKIYIPEGIEYGLPTSEKKFIGKIPTGTKFIGNKLCVGVYWENDWGANDIDLSGQNINGKVGWNSDYNQAGLMYSGDIANAPDGAIEYLYANEGLKNPTLVKSNVYRGDNKCSYKIVIGDGDDIDEDFMMNPENLILDEKCKSIQKESILGMLAPVGGKQVFVLMNIGSGSARVSGSSELSIISRKAIISRYLNGLSFNKLLLSLGVEITTEENCDIDLSLNTLEKDSFLKII